MYEHMHMLFFVWESGNLYIYIDIEPQSYILRHIENPIFKKYMYTLSKTLALNVCLFRRGDFYVPL